MPGTAPHDGDGSPHAVAANSGARPVPVVTPNDGVVLPALELAWMVARLGERARPPIPVPGPLRRVVRFAKLSGTALATVRRVLDDDPDFRARVAAAASEPDIDRASWLFLHRPPDWQSEVAIIAAGAAERAASEQAERTDRVALRRVAGLEAAHRRTDEALTAARAEIQRLTDELVGERRARKEAEETTVALERRLSASSREAQRAQGRALEAETRRADVASRLAALEVELAAATAAQAIAEATLAAAELRDEIDEHQQVVERLRHEAMVSSAQADDLRALVARAVAEAAAGAQAMAEALQRVAAVVGGSSPEADGSPTRTGEPRPPDVPVGLEAASSNERTRRGPATPRPKGIASSGTTRRPGLMRRPLSLPPAVFDDSAEAADHLVRSPGVLVLVDGYNATLSAWAADPLVLQRRRLLDAAGELAARTGAEVHVVFDGGEDPQQLHPPASRRMVRFSFSPPGVEADDVLLAMVDAADARRPVVVASSDRRVRAGAEERGANAISTPQLFAVLRRDPGDRQRLR